ncbi:MAG: hypothetical protein JWQ63_2612 [Mucilaginibacter sp.]|jgi:hypothetical protein|nr:hypothetical protein [Mucilaginibacter sp.]
MENFNEEQYQKLKDNKDFLDKEERDVYHDLQNDLYSVMQRCEKVSQLISSRQVKPTDKVDPDVLGFLPVDISE